MNDIRALQLKTFYEIKKFEPKSIFTRIFSTHVGSK